MRNRSVVVALLGLLWALSWVPSAAEESGTSGQTVVTATIKPDYLSPKGLLNLLGDYERREDRGIFHWPAGEDRFRSVSVRWNDAANLLILSGPAQEIEEIKTLIRNADVPPRQISIEAKIVEINESKSRDIGMDWERLLRTGAPHLRWSYDETNNDLASRDYRKSEQTTSSRYGDDHTVNEQWVDNLSDDESIRRHLDVNANVNLRTVLTALDESGAGTIRNAPRILTLNNRRATILDGQRVTYVTRYSSYTNLFATDSMDAGLTLSVLPSLGESGYITLHIRAELTTLCQSISGSPVKDGQMVENTVIAKDGETVLLGGFQRTSEVKTRRRFPLLGHVLPFLFSREITRKRTIETFVILTPHVVDFATSPSDSLKQIIEGGR